MMDFITVPLVVGIVALTIYRLFELFARRKERIMLIEKAGDKIDSSFFQGGLPISVYHNRAGSYGTLKAGCLLVGVGLGLLVGFFILNIALPKMEVAMLRGEYQEIASVVFGSSVMLFGGLSLLIAFVLEMKHVRNNKQEQK